MAREWPYNLPGWQKVRRFVLLRDGGRCQIKLPGCKGTATVVDHIISANDGGPPLDPSNLRAACTKCNATLANRNRGDNKSLPPSRDWFG